MLLERQIYRAGLVELSDEGTDTESDEQHRTIRGREAQQIVKRLRGTYRGRSKSANDAFYSAGQGECYAMSAIPGLLPCFICLPRGCDSAYCVPGV